MVSDTAFMFHIYIPGVKPKVKVICQGQGQILRLQFSKKWGHLCFTNTSCFPFGNRNI